jgi:CheY-like chemotaxis protein
MRLRQPIAASYSSVLRGNPVDANRLFKCRVLVVEDDPLVLQTTAAIVHSCGFSVRTAEDGFVALKVLRAVLPDIILTDLRMPGMSGFELLSIVRRRFPHIPTIAISGEYILANMPLGLLVDHFFQKGD